MGDPRSCNPLTALAVLASLLVTALSQTCTTVTEERIWCEQNNQIQVSVACDEHYILKIWEVDYYASFESDCPSPGPDSAQCHVVANPDDLLGECHKRESCNVTLAKRPFVNCFGGGQNYVRMIYSCEPLHFYNAEKAKITPIRGVETLFGYQLVYISSTEKVLTENDISFVDTSMGCVITVPPDAEAFLQMLYLVKNPSQPGCKQRVEVWDGNGYVRTLCNVDADKLTLAGCGKGEPTFYLRYINDDPTVSVGFVVALGVSHRVAGLTMRCGLPVDVLPAAVYPTTTEETTSTSSTTTSTTTTATTSTSSGAGEDAAQDGTAQDFESLKLIIILVSVAVSLIFMVIVIAFLIRRCSRKQSVLDEESEPEDLTAGKANYAFVRDIYLDGDNKSKLVMDKRRSTNISDATLAIRI